MLASVSHCQPMLVGGSLVVSDFLGVSENWPRLTGFAQTLSFVSLFPLVCMRKLPLIVVNDQDLYHQHVCVELVLVLVISGRL